MVNFLSLLGWNDGTEKEIYTVEELTEAFALDRITKSAAVFDKVKLSWMNGQHLRCVITVVCEYIRKGSVVTAGTCIVLHVCSGAFIWGH